MSRPLRSLVPLVFALALVACFRNPKGAEGVTLDAKRSGNELAIDPSKEPDRAPRSSADDVDAPIPVLANDPQEGDRNALVTIVEFSDLECPFCARGAETVEALREAFGPDEVRVVWKHYPLPFHAHARPLAEAGVGVQEIGGSAAFFRYERAIFRERMRPNPAGGMFQFADDSPRRFAEAAGVDGVTIEAGLRDGRWKPRVEADMALGSAVGVNGTPAFFINGTSLSGAQPLEKFKEVVTAELARAKELVAKGTPRANIYAVATKAVFKAPSARHDDDDDAPEPPDVAVYKVPVGNAPTRGPASALVTIVEFSDYQCPFCKRAENTVTALRTHYGDKIRIVWKDMPLDFHKDAMPAAMAAREARVQKGDAGFWDMHDRIFDHQTALSEKDLLEYGKSGGLDAGKLSRALANKTHLRAIYADQDEGDDVEAAGTPHFFVNGHRLAGAQPMEKFQEVIDAELKKAEALVAAGTPAANVYAEIQKNAVVKVAPPVTKAVALDPKVPSRGPANAKVTIVEFSDFQCPFCKRVEPVIDDLLKAYPKDVRLEWRNLPLSFHADAELAAEAALEAKAQKGSAGFFKMQAMLFDGQGKPDGLKRDALDEHAKKLGLDMGRFARALDNHVHLASIQADKTVAQGAGISGTPGFVVNGTFLSGAQSFRKFRRAVDAALAKK